MNLNRLSLIFAFFFLLIDLTGQDFTRLSPPVYEGNDSLTLAWTGGLNAPQFSEVDLNNDGVNDLFVFDRIGNVVLTFKYTDEGEYVFAPEYQERFPDLENWALLRDFNQDGAVDIFTYSFEPGAHSVEVYTGHYDTEGIYFERLKLGFGPYDVLYYPGSGNFPINLLVTNIDIPAIDDIDGDGDLDILSFSLSGGLVVYYQNQSVEMGYGTDSLIYRLEDNCWGKFYESGFSNEVTLSPDPDKCAIDLVTGGGQVRHAGSTLLTFDSDVDGDKELVLGDISFNFMVFLLNGGSPDHAHMVSQDTAFPSKSVSVDLPIFPAGYEIDIDHDGRQDLLVSPNNVSSIEDTENVWFYRDQNDSGPPSHQFVQSDLFVEDMLEAGTGSQPAFADVNGDGLVDLVIGNNTFYQAFGEKDARLLLYLNTGTRDNPEFTLTDEDFLNFSVYSTGNTPSHYFSPTFGDLDGDGDLDLMVGERWGSLFYVENLAGEGEPMDFGSIQPNFLGDDTFGQSVTPQMIDLNRDGLTDIVLGERNGNLNYFQNIGSPGNPDFDQDVESLPNTSSLGNVDTRKLGYFTGHSAPRFIEQDGRFILVAGSESRGIIQYDNIDDNLYGKFTETVSSNLGGIKEGKNVRLDLVDLDNDDFLELAVGNERGGLILHNTPFSTITSSVLRPVEAVQVGIYPNPVQDELNFVVPNDWQNRDVQLAIFSRDGKSVIQAEGLLFAEPLSISQLPTGFYFGKLTIGDKPYHFRFVKF